MDVLVDYFQLRCANKLPLTKERKRSANNKSTKRVSQHQHQRHHYHQALAQATPIRAPTQTR